MDVVRRCYQVGNKFAPNDAILEDMIEAVRAGEYILDSNPN